MNGFLRFPHTRFLGVRVDAIKSANHANRDENGDGEKRRRNENCGERHGRFRRMGCVRGKIEKRKMTLGKHTRRGRYHQEKRTPGRKQEKVHEIIV
jgi:hypothetical protein